MRSNKGFTLVELLVVVTIVGILAAVVVPSYSNYVMRGKIPDATSALAAKRVQMEQFFQDNRTYAGAPACDTDAVTSKYFTFSCAAPADAVSYTLQAVGRDSMAGFTYTINQDNAKTTAIATPAPSGWIASSTACWITKQGGTC